MKHQWYLFSCEKKLNREQKQLLISCVWSFLEQQLSNKHAAHKKCFQISE